jgi:hypothetical protein
LTPDVILAGGGSVVGLLLQEIRSVPIVFTLTPDPVGAGFVESLARPGGNATGFTLFEYGMGGKWIELLKEIAPGIRRAAVVRDPALPQGTGLFGAIQSAAPSFGVELTPVNVRDASEIERAIATFARSPDGGLIVTASVLAVLHRDLLVTLAAQQKLPAIYFHRLFVTAGGLISYGPDLGEQYARAAGYVDRILKGAKPAEEAPRRRLLTKVQISAASSSRSISAFNHPLNLIVHQVVPAIATGCPIIVKPAPETPLSCIEFVRLVHESGLEEPWCQTAILSDVVLAEKLVTDARVSFFSFIGSAPKISSEETFASRGVSTSTAGISVSRLPASRERHPIRSKGRVVIHHYS